MGGSINSGFGTAQRAQAAGAPLAAGSAINGVSLDTLGRVVLGNNVGAFGATLQSRREIPTSGFNLFFSGGGSVTIGDSPLNNVGTFGQFNSAPVLSLSGPLVTQQFNIVDAGLISGQPWGSASVVWRTSNGNAPALKNTGLFGNNVVTAMNVHYGTLSGVVTDYVNAWEFWMGIKGANPDALILSLYGTGGHFAGTFGVPSVRASNSVLIGWDTGFNAPDYIFVQPQLSLRAIGGANTTLELSNSGASGFNIENTIFFSTDNAPTFIASSFPSTKSVFAFKSTTNANGTIISYYLATNNSVQGVNLTGQEMFSLYFQAAGKPTPGMSINYRLDVGTYLTNDGAQSAAASYFTVDAFNLPLYLRNIPAAPVDTPQTLYRNPATNMVYAAPFKAPNFTTVQKNALTPAAGMLVFDTTLKKACVYSGTAWETITSV